MEHLQHNDSIQDVLFIKNMVCGRCIIVVRQLFNDLEVQIEQIELGKVILVSPLSDEQKDELQSSLSKFGFELLGEKQVQLVNATKSIIIEEIHYNNNGSLVNFSTLLAEKLHYDYAYLSRLFSAVETRTIEKYILAQKIEKVKELLTYEEMTLSEIAFEMNYSSTAHLSAQFKKVTGMSPTAFKKLRDKNRQPLDEL